MTDKPGTGELSPATFIEIRFADGKTLRAENGAAGGIWRWLMGCETMALVHGSRYEGPALEVISEGAECTGELSGATQPATPHDSNRFIEGIEAAIHEVCNGRTINNFGHVPEVRRALEWVVMDLMGLKERAGANSPAAPKSS